MHNVEHNADSILANELPDVIERFKKTVNELNKIQNNNGNHNGNPINFGQFYSLGKNPKRVQAEAQELQQVIDTLVKIKNGEFINRDDLKQVISNKYMHQEQLKIHQAINYYDNVLESSNSAQCNI